jgi:hypothetical protein
MAGVCAAGDLSSSGAARMCCKELMFAAGPPWRLV